MKPFDEELVSGGIVRSVWKLSWPVVLLNVVNGTHGFIDQVLVGRYVGTEANAGIGVGWSLFMVIVVFVSSLYHGMNVVVARYAGRRDRETMSRVMFETLWFSLVFLFGVGAPAGYFLAPHAVAAVTRPEAAAHALPYLRTLFVLGAPIFLMFLITGAMQASGDPRTPLRLGVLTTALNVILSYLLITGAGPFPAMGAQGAALATCLAPLAGAGLGLSLIFRRRTIIPPPSRIWFARDLEVFRTVLRIGLPSGVQAVMMNLAGVGLYYFISQLDHATAAQAAYAICYTQLFSLVAWPSWALRNASGTIMGQNIGAGRPRRGRRGVYVAAAFGLSWALAGGVVFVTAPAALLAVFGATTDPVLGIGVTFLRYLAISGVMIAITTAFTGGLVGAGRTVAPMVIAIVTQIFVLLGGCAVLAALDRLTAEGIWAMIVVAHTARMALTLLAFHVGKDAVVNVDVRRAAPGDASDACA